MSEIEKDLLGMEQANQYLINNPNAASIPFDADTASGLLSLYVNAAIPEKDRAQESMRLERVFDNINSAKVRESIVQISRDDYLVVRGALLAEKARRD